MGLADEFTGEMARFITKEPDTAEILSDLTAKKRLCHRPARRGDTGSTT